MQHQGPVNSDENANKSFFKKTKELAQNHPYITGVLAGTVYGLMGTAILPAAAVPFAYAGIGSLMGAGAAGIKSYLGKRKADNANLDAPAEQQPVVPPVVIMNEQPDPVVPPVVIMNEQPAQIVPVPVPVVPFDVTIEHPASVPPFDVEIEPEPVEPVPVSSSQKQSNIIPNSHLLEDKQSCDYTFGDYEDIADKFERENILPFINAPETVATPKKTPAVNTAKSPKSPYALSANINKRVKREQLDTPENPLPQQYFVVNPSNPLTKNIKMEQPRNTFVPPVIRPTAPLNLPQPESPDMFSPNGPFTFTPVHIDYNADDSMSNNSDTDNEQSLKSNKRPRNQ